MKLKKTAQTVKVAVIKKDIWQVKTSSEKQIERRNYTAIRYLTNTHFSFHG